MQRQGNVAGFRFGYVLLDWLFTDVRYREAVTGFRFGYALLDWLFTEVRY